MLATLIRIEQKPSWKGADTMSEPLESDAAMAARAAAAQYRDVLLRLPNVFGCGVSQRVVGGQRTDEWCVVVYVARKLPESVLDHDQRVPRELTTRRGTSKTDVVEATPPSFVHDGTKYRPLLGGSQISSNGNLGTLGGILFDRTDNEVVLLTCNHCLTPPGQRGYIPTDLTVRQPSGDSTVVANIKRIVPWLPPPLGVPANLSARVDAGIAALTAGTTFDLQVIDLGQHPYVILPPFSPLQVRKHGEASGTTNGTVEAAFATVRISDSDSRSVLVGGGMSPAEEGTAFSIRAPANSTFAQKGDSGSLIIDADGSASRGLLFTSDLQLGGLSWACNLADVFSDLELQTPCHAGLMAVISRATERRPHLGNWRSLPPGGSGINPIVARSVRNVEQFRKMYLADEPNGHVSGAIGRMLQTMSKELAEGIAKDEDLAGLLDEAFGEWLLSPTVYDLLEYRLPTEFGDRVRRAAEHFAKLFLKHRETARILTLIDSIGGMRVRDLLARRVP